MPATEVEAEMDGPNGDPREKIVVGIDGSKSANQALSWATRQARLTGASLEVISVWAPPTTLGWTPNWPEGLDLAQIAEDLLSKTVPEVLGADPGIDVVQTVVEGHPALVLVERSRDAALVVVGSRGHGAFAGMLLGSVGLHLASHAHCPVVIVRESPHQREAKLAQ